MRVTLLHKSQLSASFSSAPCERRPAPTVILNHWFRRVMIPSSSQASTAKKQSWERDRQSKPVAAREMYWTPGLCKYFIHLFV